MHSCDYLTAGIYSIIYCRYILMAAYLVNSDYSR